MSQQKKRKRETNNNSSDRSATTTTTKTKTVVVKFNVGGRKYEVAESLLALYPDSMLFRSASERWRPDESDGAVGEIFIERDGERFRYCLDWMRDGVVYLPRHVTKRGVRKDLEYYGIENVDPSSVRRDEGDVVDASHRVLRELDDMRRNACCERAALACFAIVAEKGDGVEVVNDFSSDCEVIFMAADKYDVEFRAKLAKVGLVFEFKERLLQQFDGRACLALRRSVLGRRIDIEK